jgi:lipopolysaccharide export system protein LptA
VLLWRANSFAQKVRKVELLNANSLEYNETQGEGVKRLIGEVAFKHDSIYMYCDSAYLYSEKNSLEAFSNIRIEQGDTLTVYSDLLKYDGNMRFAQLDGNVKLIDNQITLTTPHLDYDLNAQTAQYDREGTIVDTNNTLVSVIGLYFADKKEFFFKDKVVLTNPQYVLKSDTLKYNTLTEIAYFFGPTTISSDSNFIYCENGWYDTKNDFSQFKKNAYLQSKSQKLSGDSLCYDRKKGFGQAFNNVNMTDTAENIIIKGNYGYYYERPEKSMITDSLLYIQVLEKDSLYMHADTLFGMTDSSGKHKIIYAYHHVKLFKFDLQGKCDSMVYSFKDSIIHLYHNPVIWSDDNQLTADTIHLKTGEGKIYHINLIHTAFISSSVDSIRFNQVKGKTMKGYFRDNELYKVTVNGNSETIYYAQDDKAAFIGINKAEASDMLIFIKEKNFDKISFLSSPTATFYPMSDLKKEETFLKDFVWQAPERPGNKEGVFIK